MLVTAQLIGGGIAPYIIGLAALYAPLPQLVSGVLCAVSFVLGWFIPETSQMKLRQNIIDLDEKYVLAHLVLPCVFPMLYKINYEFINSTV